MDRGSCPSSSDFKPRVSEAEDMVVLLLSETIWIAHDTKSHILEQRTWPCLAQCRDPRRVLFTIGDVRSCSQFVQCFRSVCYPVSVWFTWKTKRAEAGSRSDCFFEERWSSRSRLFLEHEHPSVCQETPFYWLEMVTTSCFVHGVFSPGRTTLQLHISCDDEALVLFIYFGKHPFLPLHDLRRRGWL